MALLISGDAAIAAYRAQLTGRVGLDLVRQHGRVLIQLPVGIGKSWWIDEITLEAAQSGDYDLVVVLCPTRQLIKERRPLQAPPAGVKVINLRPRPVQRCGISLDAQWQLDEAADLGALGRDQICGSCRRQAGCFWPKQYGKAMAKAQIVYATQAHLERAPNFLVSLRQWAGAERMLTLFDETNFVGSSFEVVITAREINQFADVLNRAAPLCVDPRWKNDDWHSLVDMLRHASTQDLQGKWRFPHVWPGWAAAVQAIGVQQYGAAFRFPAYRIGQMAFAPAETRARGADESIRFSARPFVGDCMIFSATTDLEFARYRLGKDLVSPLADNVFRHPDTRWYNLASPIGSRKYFPGNAAQILDFFAELVLRRLGEGKRVLFVAKKCFVAMCEKELAARFCKAHAPIRLITDDFTAARLANPAVVPIINYGMIGTNQFEQFDAVYCLTGYYVNEQVVNQCLQDVTRQELRLPIQIQTQGSPRRRQASVIDANHRYYDVAHLAQPALCFQEHDVVVQAVGRVRPFTRPREVITFQMAELPGVTYDAEFCTLGEARQYFQVDSLRQSKKRYRAAQIQALRQQGKTQQEVVKLLHVSERTVRRYDK